jgi:hypothetical protein
MIPSNFRDGRLSVLNREGETHQTGRWFARFTSQSGDLETQLRSGLKKDSFQIRRNTFPIYFLIE